MRQLAIGAVIALCAACGGDDSGSAAPYSGARSAMCGAQPSGVWNVELTSPVRMRAGQTNQLCDLASGITWDFGMATYMNVYDEGCRVQSTIDNGHEFDHIELMWVATDTWSGTLTVDGLKFGEGCTAEVDATLTR